MSRFQESALRNSAGEEDSSTLPYWHPSSQFSSLINPQHEVPLVPGHQVMDYVAESQHNGLDLGLTGQRTMDFQQLSDFVAAQGMPHSLAQDQHSHAPMQHDSILSVKTPTGHKSVRRPGLAGACAVHNGQFCCQWTVDGIGCPHRFPDAKQLNDHIRSDHVRGAGNFVCYWSGCGKSHFPTANKLVRHVHSHTGYKPFPCPSCSQAFVTKDQLEKHLTTHTGAKDFVCTWPGCGRSFAVKHALDGHMNSVHLKAKKHVCSHCGQAFDDSSNLSKHKKQVHNPETGIKCPARRTHACFYVDSRKDKMKEHCERARHGLDIVHDPHAWNLWVQQFKSASKKADSRRHSRDTSVSTVLSRSSSISTSMMSPGPRCMAPMYMGTSMPRGIECSTQRCSIPVCLPCNMLCNDNDPVHRTQTSCGSDPCSSSHPCDELHQHVALETCHEEDCNPCDPCDDLDCDPSTRQPCISEPCTVVHCRSGSMSPPLPETLHDIPSEPYFAYHGLGGAHDNEMFHDPEQLQRLSDHFMFMS